ncbi:hypothetical protein [Halolamina sp.]|jgi:hypothetical protein|uniref:hypothetical protein n=1 Tax=Halolamina sp. TaxID=1940283 RepID=UPI000223B7F6|nr:hypothetical protein Halar_1919 [halophilic archaeon DL31]
MDEFSCARFVTLAVVVLLISSSVGSVAAQANGEPEWAGELETNVNEMIPAYNERAGEINLGPLSLSGTTNVYVYDADSDGDGVSDGEELATFQITMDRQNRITNFERGTSDDAARKLTTDRATLEGIANTNNPAAAFRSAIANDKIVISGESGQFVEGLKWTIVNAFKGLFL